MPIDTVAERPDSRYTLSLNVEAVTLRELEEKLIDLAGTVHNLTYYGHPVAKIDSEIRAQGATLKAVPRGTDATVGGVL